MYNKKIKEAEEFAKKAHKGQKRKDGRPYFGHTVEVALQLKKWKQDDEVIIAGFLHDVVEDTKYTLEDIEKKFGKRVAYLVDGASWIFRKGKKDIIGTYKKIVKHSIKDPSLVLIKAADHMSNIAMYKVEGREYVVNKVCKKNREFYIPLFESAGLKGVADKVKKETDKFSKKKYPILLYKLISKKDLEKIRCTIKK